MDELRNKLLKSTAVVTAKMEADVCRSCTANNWKAKQGVYYEDLNHSKYRELDVCATQNWEYTSNDNQKETIRIAINILAEVKTMAGYHLIFDNLNDVLLPIFQSNYCDWVGYSVYDEKLKIFNILANQGINKNNFHTIIDSIYNAGYPNDRMRLWPLLIYPSKAKCNSGSFRETNIGSEKELENSVLWKACQSLWSSIESFKDQKFKNYLHDLEVDALVARQTGHDESWFELSIEHHSSNASLFHPVIVTEAQLWKLNSSGEEIEQIDSTRLFFRNHYGGTIRWFDVVNINAFDSWIADISTQYKKALIENGGKQVSY